MKTTFSFLWFALHLAHRVEFGDDVVLAVRAQLLEELLNLFHSEGVAVLDLALVFALWDSIAGTRTACSDLSSACPPLP